MNMGPIQKAFICLLASVATPAAAQDSYMWNMPIGNWQGTTQFNNEAISGMVEHGTGKTDADDKISTTGPSLTFTPSAAVRAKVVEDFKAGSKLGSPNFASVETMEQFDQQVMKPFNVQSDNVADVFALWWISSWLLVAKTNYKPTAQSIAKVKLQAAQALLSGTQLSSANDNKKQAFADALILQTLMLFSQMDAVKNDPAQRAQLAKAVNDGAKTMGLDLTQMTLTEQGFAMR